MAPTAKLYGPALSAFLAGVSWTSDTIKAMFLTSAYTFDQDAHDFVNDVSGSQIAIVSTTLSSAASAGATTISTAATIAIGNMISVDGELRKVTGVTGAGPYTLTLASALSSAHSSGAAVTAGQGYTSGGITLASKTVTYDSASNTTKLDAADLSLTGNPLGARYVVVYKDTGTAGTSPVLVFIDLGDDATSSGGAAWQLNWATDGVFILTTPA